MFGKRVRNRGRGNFRRYFLPIKELEDENIGEIKEECEFDKIQNTFDEGAIPPQLDFFYGYICQKILDRPVIFYHLMTKILDLLIFFALTEVKIL